MNKLVYIDTETTGLDPDRHEIWEVAAIIVDDDNPINPTNVKEHTWQLHVDISKADLIALNIGKFHERRQVDSNLIHPHWFSKEFMPLTWGATIVGAIPSFDCQRIEKLIRQWGCIAGWHYHLIDVEALAIGYLQGLPISYSTPKIELPVKSDWIMEQLGIEVDQEAKHTALGDARVCREVFRKVMGYG